jgi:inner membrane transporter RhtA
VKDSLVKRVSTLGRPPPHLYFVGSAIFHYLGPSFAVLLFAVVPVAGVAWLRIVSAGLVFAIWRRPWRIFARSDAATRWLIIGLGAVFAVMNYSFYLAIDALPLGTVAAIEFVGPIVLAVAGSRTLRNFAAVALAMGGVWLLTDVRLEGSVEGFVWAFVNATLFTAYIVLAHRLAGIAAGTSPIDRLGASMLVAAVVITPLGLVSALPAMTDIAALAAGAGVGISSSVIPYVLDQLAMRQLARETYSLFVALLPATAVVVGLVVLRQVPAPVEVAGVALVIAGVVLHQDARQPATVSA